MASHGEPAGAGHLRMHIRAVAARERRARWIADEIERELIAACAGAHWFGGVDVHVLAAWTGRSRRRLRRWVRYRPD